MSDRTPSQSPRRGPDSRPRFVVHSLSHARAAATAAAEAKMSVVFASGVGAAGYGGAGWFAEMTAAAAIDVPDAAFDTLLDCADDAAIALEALAAGIGWIAFSGPDEVLAQIISAADECGARVNGAEGPVLDCHGVDDLDRACWAFLDAHRRAD